MHNANNGCEVWVPFEGVFIYKILKLKIKI